MCVCVCVCICARDDTGVHGTHKDDDDDDVCVCVCVCVCVRVCTFTHTPVMILVSLENIKQDDELLVSYGLSFWNKHFCARYLYQSVFFLPNLFPPLRDGVYSYSMIL